MLRTLVAGAALLAVHGAPTPVEEERPAPIPIKAEAGEHAERRQMQHAGKKIWNYQNPSGDHPAPGQMDGSYLNHPDYVEKLRGFIKKQIVPPAALEVRHQLVPEQRTSRALKQKYGTFLHTCV